MNLRAILLFLFIFGMIIYMYIYYETIITNSYIYTIVKVFAVLLAILSISFPHVMDYLKYSDNANISIYDILHRYHSNQNKI